MPSRSIKRQVAAKMQGQDEEELLLQKANERRIAREERCVKAITDVLAKHKCRLQIYVHIGEQKVPINAVLALPVFIAAASLK